MYKPCLISIYFSLMDSKADLLKVDKFILTK